jgi:hypothetical protein
MKAVLAYLLALGIAGCSVNVVTMHDPAVYVERT